jgi:hypothetical protein
MGSVITRPKTLHPPTVSSSSAASRPYRVVVSVAPPLPITINIYRVTQYWPMASHIYSVSVPPDTLTEAIYEIAATVSLIPLDSLRLIVGTEPIMRSSVQFISHYPLEKDRVMSVFVMHS